MAAVEEAPDVIWIPPVPREEIEPVNAVRGYVFVSGRPWLRQRGLLDRYMELLPQELHRRFDEITALEWVPIDEAMLSYAVCDRMELSSKEMRELGAFVSAANNGAFVETLARLAGGFGISPWVALKSLHKVWPRSNRGGAVAVYRVADREARIELWNVPMVRSRFFCVSFCGALEHGLALFRRNASVTEIESESAGDDIALRATW
ncbi:MAG: hypothetical protein AAGF12_42335 [Myxococcota bacterium]